MMRTSNMVTKGLRPCPRCAGTGRLLDAAYQGAQARKQRMDTGVSLRELARRMELSVAYLSDLELGRRGWNEAMTKRYLKALRG